MKTIKRIAAATALTTGLGLAGLGAASLAEAQPAGPFPDYHWCPGEFYDPGWGNNWDWNRCHDDSYFDGEPRDQGHWHGQGGWHQDGPGPWQQNPWEENPWQKGPWQQGPGW